MRRRTLHPEHPPGRINVTPMIDVIMCLIVFYLLVGQLVETQRSEVVLPEAHSGQKMHEQELFVINVLPDEDTGSKIVVDGQPVSPFGLESLVRKRLELKENLVVHVRADRTLAYGAVDPVVRACRGAGVRALRLSTEHVP